MPRIRNSRPQMKKEIRNRIRAQKGKHHKEELAFFSHQAEQKLLADKMVREAHVIMAYCSLPDEVDTSTLIDKLLLMDKTVLLPVVAGDDILLRRYEGKDTLQSGAFNILEPTGDLYEDYELIDVAIIPGMAFDMNGNRLGRGKGYYDRFLPKIPQAKKIGVCFPFQLVESVPCESFDIPVDRVITGILYQR